MANPFLDAESAELRLNFVHDSIAKNGVALLVRKTPAKIRLQKEKLLEKVVEIRDINVIFPQGSNCKWKELKVIDLFEPKGGNMTYSKTWAKNNPGKM